MRETRVWCRRGRGLPLRLRFLIWKVGLELPVLEHRALEELHEACNIGRLDFAQCLWWAFGYSAFDTETIVL
jgi:hypothetical protein